MTSIVAAPGGVRVGLTAAMAGSRQLTICVLPKAWRPPAASRLHTSAGSEQAITLYETDRLHISTPPPDLEQILANCLRLSRRASGEAAGWPGALIAPDVAPSDAELGRSRPIVECDGTAVTDLLMLFDRLRLLVPENQELGGSPTHSPLHRPLLCRRFLNEVFALANSARRGYRNVVAEGTSVRGRVQTSSLARYALTGDPRLTFRYDELTESTILLGVITAAVESIADASGLRSPFVGEYSVSALQQDAVRLRRVFTEIESLPPAKAHQVGRRLRLSRIDQPWSAALQMALTLLTMQEYGTRFVETHPADAVELSIPTDKLWERIVTESLRRASFTDVFAQEAQPRHATSDPWLAPGRSRPGTRPDNIGRYRGQLWVVDAKYKTLAPEAAPTRDDQYQMFAYSHLVELDDQAVKRVALVYPGEGEVLRWRRGRTPNEAPVHLLALQIPFPSPAEVRSAGTWHSYLDRAAERLRVQLAA